jgi:hypothetical protein
VKNYKTGSDIKYDPNYENIINLKRSGSSYHIDLKRKILWIRADDEQVDEFNFQI